MARCHNIFVHKVYVYKRTVIVYWIHKASVVEFVKSVTHVQMVLTGVVQHLGEGGIQTHLAATRVRGTPPASYKPQTAVGMVLRG